jgi:hypothetical protein
MAMKMPPAGTSASSPVATCRRRAPVTPTPGPPRIFSTVLFQIQPILGLRCARSCMIFDARRVSRRCTTVTLFANFVRKVASSMAVSPPPTTSTSLPL